MALEAPVIEPDEGRCPRVAIEAVRPNVDGGRFPVKREVGDVVEVDADVFTDGQDELACELRWRHDDEEGWATAPMVPIGNDAWRGRFEVARQGVYHFVIRAVIDKYGTWLRDALVKAAAGQGMAVELLVGAELLGAAAKRAQDRDRSRLLDGAEALRQWAESEEPASALDGADSPARRALLLPHVDPATEVTSEQLSVAVERTRARFSAWYELFPRSTARVPGRHGTLADVEHRLGYVAKLGFDVLYLPPIHPIGCTNRKGRDGATRAETDDPGSPWAIGSAEGGHTAVDPSLGTIDDFDRLVARAERLGIEVGLDLAFQCSPDHPWVTTRPQWFRRLPDESIRYAENPPKRYEDIYPIDFDTDDWRDLWSELLEVVRFWVGHGVRVFRVDNPHTKPFAFWEWLIAEVKAQHPEVLFLSEAFTRPKIMHRLAKIGFSQSYTYFAWRNAKWELEQYLGELHHDEAAEYFRPNLWPNTPDILTETLQHGTRATFMARLVLAATGASSYGIYGPAFELQEHEARSKGSEEYLHSEKYQVRHWDLDASGSLAEFISLVNAVRKENPALQHDRNLQVHHVDNEALIVYSRVREANRIVVAVNLDPQSPQSGWVELDLAALGIGDDHPYIAHDLLTGARYPWHGQRNFVALDPATVPAHILRIEEADPPPPPPVSTRRRKGRVP